MSLVVSSKAETVSVAKREFRRKCDLEPLSRYRVSMFCRHRGEPHGRFAAGSVTDLHFARHVLGAVYQVSGHYDVETRDGGQRHNVVHQEPDHDHDLGIGGLQLLGERVTDLQPRHVVVVPDGPHVAVQGGRHGARHGQTPDGEGHGDRELGGPSAANGRVQFSHRVHDGEEPVRTEGRQREHSHAH